MRIQTAADSLLTTLDSAVSHDDTTDKGLFARLLHAQPETRADSPDDEGTAKKQAQLPVHAAPADTDTASAASTATAPATTSVKSSTSTAPSTTAAATSPASEQTATSSLSAPSDAELLESEAEPLDAVPTTAPAAINLLSAAKATPVPLASALDSALTESSKTEAAMEKSHAALTTGPSTPQVPAGKSVQSVAASTNPAASAETTAPDKKSVSELAVKTSARSKTARDTNTTVATPELNPGTTELPDANAPASLAASLAENNAAATAATDGEQQPAIEADNAASMTTTAWIGNRITAGQQFASPTTTATTAATTTEADPALTSAADESLAAGNSFRNSPMTQRGLQLPRSGKSLPLATDSADSSSQNLLQQVFKELADSAPLQNQAAAADTAALQANQNALNAISGNPDSQETSASSQQAANAAAAPLSTLPGGMASTVTSNSSSLQAPFVFASSLAMNGSGWGEEAAHHIRWLKDHDQQSAEIQLHPAELGRLSITIDMKDGQASVQLVAGSAEAKELLEKALPELRNLLAQSGMSLTDSSVAQHSGGQQTWSNRFSPAWFDSDELKPTELPAGKPAMFRSAGGSHRIDQYV